MILAWGDEYTQIYNDGYSQLIGDKHPGDVGADLRKSLAEGWDVLGPLVEAAKETGIPTWIPQLQLLLNRSGYKEESYFAVSHAPAFDDYGQVGGMHAVCNEVTEQVLSDRRLTLLQELSLQSANTLAFEEAAAVCLSVLGRDHMDLPFVRLFLLGSSGFRCTEMDESAICAPETWALDGAIEGVRLAKVPADVEITGGPWNDPVTEAIVLPLRAHDGSLIGALVCGANPNRALDENYHSFFETLGRQVSVALANAQAYQNEAQRVAALEQLDRVKTAFFNNMSHEMRTPMNAIIGGSSLLLGTAVDAEQQDLTTMIQSSADHLLDIVNNVLDYSKLDAGKMEYESKPFDVRACFEDASRAVELQAREKNIDLTVDVDEGVPANLLGDVVRLRQVVLNLLSNAVKFTEEGSVTVHAEHLDGWLRVRVVDTGTGIAPEQLGDIFEAFNQASRKVSTGTGLGLSISKALTEGMGGVITVHSELGSGSTFSIALPAEATDLIPEQDAGVIADPTFAQRSPLSILIAEDHPVNVKVVTLMLARLGYTAVVVDNGRAAVEAAAADDFDLILMDIQMPDMSGLEAAKKIMAAKSSVKAPRIVAMTANARYENRQEAAEAGMQGFLSKPMTMRSLLAVLSGTQHIVPVEAPAPSADEVLDVDRLRTLYQASPEAMDEVVETFVVNGLHLLTQIGTGKANSDDVAADIALHRLKGSSATLGGNELAHLCELLRSGESQDWLALPAAFDRFVADLRKFNDEFAKTA